MSWRTNRKTRQKFPSGLHPFVARPSIFEPVLTTGQKLTPAQKEHLEEFGNKPMEVLYNHLVSVHGDNLPPLHYHSGLDPEVAKRFNIPTEDTLVSREQLRIHHLRRHVEDMEERARTAPKSSPLTKQEYEQAGIDVAPGFQE
jgi:hypothetical protein